MRTDKLTYDIKGNPLIPKNKFLDFEIFKNIIQSDSCKELNEVQFCGTIDDPLMHPQFLEMIEFLANKNIHTIIHTNASLRTPEYFKKLGSLLNGKVQFSIDGLEDTNHLYRRGTIWKKIIENAKAFITAGGNAQWQYIVFPWNEHQISEAEILAKELGFNSFKYRYDRSNAPLPSQYEEQINENKKFLSLSWKEYTDKRVGKLDYEIDCFSKSEKMYFIGYDATVWPCCFLHNAKWTVAGNHQEYFDRYSKNYGTNWNNLNHYTFDEIINNNFYKEDLVDSWSSKTHGTGCKDRIIRCTETCSKKSLPVGKFETKSLDE